MFGQLRFTVFVGLCFIVLALMYNMEYIDIDERDILQLSLAAFMFILHDQFAIGAGAAKKEEKFRAARINEILAGLTLLAAAASLVILPFVELDMNTRETAEFNNKLLFLGLGIVITVPGLRGITRFGLIGELFKKAAARKSAANRTEERIDAPKPQ